MSRRVELICNSVDKSRWYYISSEENPADLASRPQTTESLLNSKWVRGPDALWQPGYSPPHPDPLLPDEELPEIDEKVVLKVNTEKESPFLGFLTRARSWKSILKSVRFVQTLLHWLDRARQRLKKPVSLAPRPPATSISSVSTIAAVVRMAQDEYDTTRNVDPGLSPFCDALGTIRVGGRLAHSHLPYEGKHPLMIPGESPIARLIISHFHERTRHQGRVITLAAIRNAGYFIPALRAKVSSFIKACPTCIKLRAKPLQPKMADLPPCRVQESPPFSYVGIDVFGPFNVTEGYNTRRTNSTRKVWCLLFICQSSRAVHIETIPGMDTSSCRNALTRFFALRGTPKRILSDNGSNFISSKSQLDSSYGLSLLQEAAKSHGLEWTMNPPKASSFGGSWERAIGSVRKILNASLVHLGKRSLNRDELSTLVQEACCIINNTPLFDVSDDPNDPFPLTPAQLLLLRDHPFPSPPEEFSPADLNSYGKLRWRRIQQLSSVFWDRWRKNYLHTLQTREKWFKDRPNPEVGDAVILKQKDAKRNQWDVARIVSVSPSADGVVRSCTVRTPKGTYRRPTNLLVPLTPHEKLRGGSVVAV